MVRIAMVRMVSHVDGIFFIGDAIRQPNIVAMHFYMQNLAECCVSVNTSERAHYVTFARSECSSKYSFVSTVIFIHIYTAA